MYVLQAISLPDRIHKDNLKKTNPSELFIFTGGPKENNPSQDPFAAVFSQYNKRLQDVSKLNRTRDVLGRKTRVEFHIRRHLVCHCFGWYLNNLLGILQKIIVGFTVLLAVRTTGLPAVKGRNIITTILLQSQEMKLIDVKSEVNQAGENK